MEPAPLSFTVHYNGARPYAVLICGGVRRDKKFAVSSGPDRGKVAMHIHNPDRVVVTNTITGQDAIVFDRPRRVFVGYSTPSPTAGPHGAVAAGNTILIHEKDTTYVLVGRSVERFAVLSEIEDFVSLLGPSDVPYPYAIDTADNCYLFDERVILLARHDRHGATVPPLGDPYRYFYDNNHIRDLDDVPIEWVPTPTAGYARLCDAWRRLGDPRLTWAGMFCTLEEYTQIQIRIADVLGLGTFPGYENLGG